MQSYDENYDAYIEELRAEEYPNLLETTYLDHAGTTLYATSFVDSYRQDLLSNLYGNPHSDSPASWRSSERIRAARSLVLDYINADPNVFDVIFCANATAAVKIVAECFRDVGFWYGYHKDSHNSIVGVREVATTSQCFASDEDVAEWVKQHHTGVNLFAYPAQSNLTGYRLPYSWSARFQKAGAYVLLDAASFLTSGTLDLRDDRMAPDFVALSFYKIFGYPDLGALIVKNTAWAVMQNRKYFGGGTVEQVAVVGDVFHVRRSRHLHDFLEDGTLPFRLIVALKHAVDTERRIFRSRKDISRHTAYLSGLLFHQMQDLKHANGMPVLDLYKDKAATYGDPRTQGPILSFSVLKNNGLFVGKSHVERLAIDCGFQIRTGGVCNPGGLSSVLGLEHWELRRNFAEGQTCGDDNDVMGGKPTGIIRISLGPMSTKSDVMRFAEFLKEFFVEKEEVRHEVEETSGLITPLEGGPGVFVEDCGRYKVFENRWCIIDLESGKVLKPVKLAVEIDVDTEELVFNKDFRMSLWDVPSLPNRSESSEHLDQPFGLYSGEVNAWLFHQIGLACALGRYSTKKNSRAPEDTTCVVCTLGHASKIMLHEHYKHHASIFLKRVPFKRSVPHRRSWKQKVIRWIGREAYEFRH